MLSSLVSSAIAACKYEIPDGGHVMQVSFSEEQNNNSPKQLSSLRDSYVPSEKDKTPNDEEHKRIDSSTNSITELPIAKKEA